MISEKEERLHLYNLQNELLEHKFPHNAPTQPEYIISCAGDIYREIAGRGWPAPMYIGEKLYAIKHNVIDADIPWWQWALETSRSQAPAYYNNARDEYLKNLSRLYKATEIAQISFDRKEAMLLALRLQSAIIQWYETLSTRDHQVVKRNYNALVKATRIFTNFRPDSRR